MYLKNKSPRRSDAKIKEGVFVGPQIRQLTQDVKSEDQLCEVVPRQVGVPVSLFIAGHSGDTFHRKNIRK